MAAKSIKATRVSDGKVVRVNPEEINGNADIVGLDRMGQTLSLLDEAFVQKIERRIMAGATKRHEVMSDEEAERLADLNIEVKLVFTRNQTVFTNTLADDLIFTDDNYAIVDKKIEAKVKAKVRSAQRFVLTEAAAVKVAEAIRSYPEMLVEHGVFARTPFETCWIEMPSWKFHDTIVPGSNSDAADLRVGYLFDGDDVYVVAQRDEQVASISPLVIHLHHPMPFKEQIRLSEELQLSRMSLDQFFWGGMMGSSLPYHLRRGLRDQHGFSLRLREQFKGKFKGDDFLRFTAGEIRNVLGLLLMINQPSNVLRAEKVEHRRMMTRKGSRVLMGHSIITLHLDKRSRPDRLLRIPRGAHRSPKWHEVINHWCHDKIARQKGYNPDDPKTYGRGDHAHEWEQAEDGSLRFTCKICGGKRWRRIMKNGRGDRSRGVVSQSRVVKATEADND